jgi:PRTRC genetic system ParB family protein
MQTIHLSQIRTGPNPRGYFDEHAMTELIASVRERGIIQPIVVRPLPDEEAFQIIAGERRYRAAQAAFSGDYLMPCVVRDVGDEEAEAIALTENVQRDAMSATEEAVAAQKIVLRNSGDKDEAARSLGWTRDKLDRRLALLHCSKEVRDALDRRLVTLGHAELLATLSQERQAKVLAGVLKHNVSVHDLKSQLGQFAHSLSDAIFDTTECRDCISNSARQKVLFGEHIDGDSHCTNPAHYEELTEIALKAKADGLRDAVPMVRIVRIEDGFAPIRIVADGAGAVGAEQAKACRSCGNFGAAVSALPGCVGEVFEENCFDATCNTRKRAAHIRALQPPAAPKESKTAAAPGTARRSAATSKGEASAAVSAVPRVVQEYRIARWREMLAAVLARDSDKARRFLTAMTLSGNARWIDRSRLARAAEKVAGLKGFVTFRDSIETVGGAAAETIERVLPLVPAAAAFGIEPTDLGVAMTWAEVNEGEHWIIDEPFLKLLTKSELEAVADEIGLKAHLGAAFKKIVAGKRDELIAGLLGAKGFDFKGKVPAVMRYERKR